jgi:hypothetical protein
VISFTSMVLASPTLNSVENVTMSLVPRLRERADIHIPTNSTVIHAHPDTGWRLAFNSVAKYLMNLPTPY